MRYKNLNEQVQRIKQLMVELDDDPRTSSSDEARIARAAFSSSRAEDILSQLGANYGQLTNVEIDGGDFAFDGIIGELTPQDIVNPNSGIVEINPRGHIVLILNKMKSKMAAINPKLINIDSAKIINDGKNIVLVVNKPKNELQRNNYYFFQPQVIKSGGKIFPNSYHVITDNVDPNLATKRFLLEFKKFKEEITT